MNRVALDVCVKFDKAGACFFIGFKDVLNESATRLLAPGVSCVKAVRGCDDGTAIVDYVKVHNSVDSDVLGVSVNNRMCFAADVLRLYPAKASIMTNTQLHLRSKEITQAIVLMSKTRPY